MSKMLAIIAGVVAVGVGYITYKLYEVPDLPKFDYDKWWGDGPKAIEDTAIRSFKIEFHKTTIEDLKHRLRNVRPLTQPLEGIQSEYGMNTDYLKKLLTYWLQEYDFQKREDLLNQFPHYKTRIQGLDLHFIRVKPQEKPGIKVLPLLMLHGWPSSSKEFAKVIPILTTPKEGYDFVFEVIAADLPGFGFSQVPYKYAFIFKADKHSEVVTGITVPIANSLLREDIPLKTLFSYMMRESGYFHIQATKPDTIGVALTDSPAGLAAYIMEKIAICSNKHQLDTPHGGLDNLDLDDVLDTVVVTWVNNCIVTSMRIYSEGYTDPIVNLVHKVPTKVPTAAINFLHEVMYHPDWILRDKFPNLVRSTAHEFGGHFAALHTPQEFADDVFAAGREFLKFHSMRRS